MGNKHSRNNPKNYYQKKSWEVSNSSNRDFRRNSAKGLGQLDFESCNLIFGVDFTKSNEWNGKEAFDGRSLHDISQLSCNPYQSAMRIIGKTLGNFDEDMLFRCYGFGDKRTEDQQVFSFFRNDLPCNSIENVLNAYNGVVPHVEMAGPTSFAPIIDQACKIARQSRSYHILFIIADGQVTRSVDTNASEYSSQEKETVAAICRASYFPLSIILVGVGDGPWGAMKTFGKWLPKRNFDNFHFINFHDIMSEYNGEDVERHFAMQALSNIPDQYRVIRKLGYLSSRHHFPSTIGSKSILQPPRKQSWAKAPESTENTPPVNLGTEAHEDCSIICQRCTFANHRSLPVCEMCGSILSGVDIKLHGNSFGISAEVSSVSISSFAQSSSTDFAICSAPCLPEFTSSHTSMNSKSAEVQLNELIERQTCPICLDSEKNFAFNCGHQTCHSCGDTLQHCPICRVVITNRIRLFD